jgi:hypothetical protein
LVLLSDPYGGGRVASAVSNSKTSKIPENRQPQTGGFRFWNPDITASNEAATIRNKAMQR